MSSSAKGKQPAVPAQRATAAYREYDHPERQSLINELLDNLNLHGHLHAELQGFLWISDIRRLRGLVRNSRDEKMSDNSENENDNDEVEDDDNEDEDDEMDIDEEDDDEGEDDGDKGDNIGNIALPLLFQTGYRSARVSETWCTRARLRKVPASPSKNLHPDEIDPKARDEAEKQQASKRDEERCVVTKMGGPYEVAHIYPFSLNQHTDQSAMMGFWRTLSTFWSTTQVKAWKKAVMGKKGTERPTNMLTLSPTVHRLWGDCFFALKPIRVISKRKMVVEFHWLQPRPKAKKQLMVNARIRPDCLAEVDSPGQDIRLLHSPSKTIITSGTRIVIRTDDHRERPLPSFALLQMQWNLQRVAALSAMAEWRDESDGNSDDDDATGLGSVPPFWDVDNGSDDEDDDDGDDDEDDNDDHSPFGRRVSPFPQQQSSDRTTHPQMHQSQASSHPHRDPPAFVSPKLTASPPQMQSIQYQQSSHSPRQPATQQQTQRQHHPRQQIRHQQPQQAPRQQQPQSRSPQSQPQQPRATRPIPRSSIQPTRTSLRPSPSLSTLSSPNSLRSSARTSPIRYSVESPSRLSGGPSRTRQPSRFFPPQQTQENQPPSPSKASARRGSVESPSRLSGGPSRTRQPSRFFPPQQTQENQPPSPSKASERRGSVSSISDREDCQS